MKAVKILILGMFLGVGAMAQTVTPNPGPYQPVSTKFQYTWLKFIGGIWNAGKMVQDDTAYFSGLVYIPTALQADSNTQAANTQWVKKWVRDNISGGGGGGVPVTRIWLDSLRRSGLSDTIYEYYSSFAGVDGRRFAFLAPSPGSGTGTVTSFSAGTLSPLFTTSVATSTTTPALSFTQSNVNQFEILGRKASGSGAYSFLPADSSLIPGLHSQGFGDGRYAPIGAVTSIGTANVSPGANGASITAGVLSLSYANSSTRPGIVSTSAQNFFGQKNFQSGILSTTVGASLAVSTDVGMRIGPNSIAPVAGQLVMAASDPFIMFTLNDVAAPANVHGALGTKSGNLVYLIPGTNSTTFSGTEIFRIVKSSGNFLIGTSTDVASSTLTVESTTKGVLFPRMTTTQKNAISSPTEGLIVYDTTLHKLCVYTGSAWETVTSL